MTNSVVYCLIMIKLNLHQVKAGLSKYVEMVEAGETVVICKRNVPVAEIRPIVTKKKKPPQLGWADGEFTIPTDFNQMTDEEAVEWEGDEADPLRKYAPGRLKSKT